MAIKVRKEDALSYHEQGQPGKIEVTPTKALTSQLDLALAYSPGVAEPCKAIAENPEDAYRYTAKGNLVAVISNGTAVLGLGNIGALASKPVMEGKGVLFKKFAGIDVFDIEIDCEDPQEFIRIVKSLEPTFGGINLEDIKAPESFLIEQTLRKEMNIPIMHDDQHGTAIISGAALLNALELVGKKIEDIKVVVNGAGASAIACSNLYIDLGVRRENLIMLDSRGVLTTKRTDLDEYKSRYARDLNIETLEQAIEGADMFLGLSKANIFTPEMLRKMADKPIVFALANPDPEIEYELAMATRNDIIMATGRSDHPNQVNNVLGFPYIFRGALDVRATTINEAMKLAAVRAIAELAKQPVPDAVSQAYGDQALQFGVNYLIPKPLDPRLITTISPAVAKAAMESGVAKAPITDWAAYELELQKRIGIEQRLTGRLIETAKKSPKRVVFGEADNIKILRAAQIVRDQGIAEPILLGNEARIRALIEENMLELSDCPIFDPLTLPERCADYAQNLYQRRQRRGITLYDAQKLMRDRNYFGCAMVDRGEADVFLSGLTKHYPKVIRPALEVIGVHPKAEKLAGMYILVKDNEPLFLADTTINQNPSAEEIVEIIGLTAESVRFFGFEPRIATLSYSNFGSAEGEDASKMQAATALAQERYPDLLIDGELQPNVALDQQLLKDNYPFSPLAEKGVNTLIFPNLSAGNITYKMLQVFGTEAIGPIVMGLRKPVHVLQLGSSVREIVNMVAVAVVQAQRLK
ncbi:NADP-dependent malic enzyme [Eisenibacter elegans]|jgi:malate dehydrogenase (oxaloacetate-decarboxylating)(NADP+)|uniref:NADP-dependent malic enzyme n=1 Tax=Eisenibacter elegans TaxID=997 RepID=UPI000407B681|nr:NADP-dependent malic enzyme [Eisenibacter elegans]